MTLQGSLTIEYDDILFILVVKTIFKKGVYYFFITDKEHDPSLLEGETLKLSFADAFCGEEEIPEIENWKIAPEKIVAIKTMLLENKKLWFY